MAPTLEIAGITVQVLQKDIKNLHLSVFPPAGAVRVSAPLRMRSESIRAYVAMNMGWIKTERRKFMAQVRESPREFVDRESHYVWGKRCLLKVVEADVAPDVRLRHDCLSLTVRPGTSVARKGEILADWYRQQVREAVLPLVEKWQKKLGVRVNKLFFQHMKTRWGSCNAKTRNLRFNTELSRKPMACLEYIVVHEMLHLIEKGHSERFFQLLDKHAPNWKAMRRLLNSLPVRHEAWSY